MDSEQKLLRYIADNENALLAFARDLVATPSPTPPGNECAVADRVLEELGRLSLPKPQIIAAHADRPNLLLRLAGRAGGPTLILNGHLDTKPPGPLSQWKTPPYHPQVRDGKLYGLGSTDMKAAVAAIVYAAAALAQLNGQWQGELQLVLSADEEGGSAFGVKYLAQNGHLCADAALIGEPVGIRRELEYIDLDSRGIACFRIRVYGDQMHSSLSDEFQAVNASVKAAELLARLPRDFTRPGLTVNAGVTLRGGVSFGVVPGEAEFGCDFRVPIGSTEPNVRMEVQNWLDDQMRRDTQLRASLIWEPPPSTWIDPVQFPRDHPLARAVLDACGKVLAEVPPIGCMPAATDAPWFVAAGIPTIPAMGPGLLPLAHSPNEHVEIGSMFACARIYALTAFGYLR